MRSTILLTVASLTTGCLSSTYRIAPAELQRVAMTDPQERGRALRVVQRTSFSEDPPAEEYEQLPPAQCYNCGPNIWIGGHVHVGPGPVPGPRPVIAAGPRPINTATPVASPAPLRATPPGTTPPLRATPPGAGARPTSSGGGGGGIGNLDVKGDKAAAVIVVVAAAAFTVGMIATEGARYDGWVATAPDQPVHLRLHDGRYWTVPLHALDPGMAAAASEGILVEGEYTGVTQLARAPLDRVGAVWRMEGGGFQLATDSLMQTERPLTGGANISLGFFPHQKIGILGTIAFAGGTHLGGDVFTTRYGLELDAMPLKAGPFHLGAFGWGGAAYTSADGGELLSGSRQVGAGAAGLLAELELTTRLALSLRGGAMMELSGEHAGTPLWMFGAGFSIY